MKAHVICCNDSVKFVVIGDEADAEHKLEELASEEFEKQADDDMTYAEYRVIRFWHIHTVDAEKGGP